MAKVCKKFQGGKCSTLSFKLMDNDAQEQKSRAVGHGFFKSNKREIYLIIFRAFVIFA